MKSTIRLFSLCALPLLLAGCGAAPVTPSSAHLPQPAPAPAGDIPPPVRQTTFIAPPAPSVRAETYTVVVNDVPVRELLFALARDAKLNVDVSNDITGNVTLNAIDQTLPQILDRIAKQVDMRYEINGPNLAVMPDTPFLRNYKVDYVNMTRDASATASVATQIVTTGSGNIGNSGGAGGGGSSNNSTTAVTNTSNNRFWTTLVQNVQDILRETDKVLPDGSSITTVEQNNSQSTTGTGAPPATGGGSGNRGGSPTNLAGSPNAASMNTNNSTTTQRVTYREAASVIANPETGVLAVRATSRQHEKVREFLDQVLANAKRQVMIEATIVEVQLSDQYQQGIDWQRLSTSGTGKGWNFSQYPQGNSALPTGASPSSTYLTPLVNGQPIYGAGNPSLFLLNYTNPSSKWGNITATIALLESFGKVKVLSSPKLSVLNNQTALLKVVDNKVYFTITVTPATYSAGVIQSPPTYTTTINTVPVGFLMSVTPQISDSGEVTLNVRPTISRIIGYVKDPNPQLAQYQVESLVPEIQTREMESLLKIPDGQVGVMGGLMQDSINDKTDAVPGLSKLPLVGNMFTYHNDVNTKSELVIFLRPTIIHDASLTGDFAKAGVVVPGDDFFVNDKAGASRPVPAKKAPGKEADAP